MKIVALLPIVLALLPSVIKAVEAAFGPGNGDQKKQAVKDAITGLAASVAGVDPNDAELIGSAVSLALPVVDAIVAAFNLFGIFKKAKPATA